MSRQKRCDWKMIAICVPLSISLLGISGCWVNRISNDFTRILLLTVLTSAATAAMANTLWEAVAKHHFAREVLELVNMSESIVSSGIERVFPSFLRIDWKDELARSKSFDAVLVYGRTWRESNRDILADYAKRGTMRVILPNPWNAESMAELDRRFSYESGRTRQLIEECMTFFRNLEVEVLFFDRTLQASYYRTDHACYMSFFPHRKEKDIVPAIKAVPEGNFHRYISGEIDAIVKQSKAAPDRRDGWGQQYGT